MPGGTASGPAFYFHSPSRERRRDSLISVAVAHSCAHTAADARSTMAAPDGIDHVHRNKCIQEASTAGVKGAAFGIALSAPLVYLAHRMSPRFASFTTSTKTGLIVTPFFGFFFLNSELAMNSCAQRRAEFAQAVPK